MEERMLIQKTSRKLKVDSDQTRKNISIGNIGDWKKDSDLKISGHTEGTERFLLGICFIFFEARIQEKRESWNCNFVKRECLILISQKTYSTSDSEPSSWVPI